MSDEAFSMSFDPKSLSEITQFYGFPTLLSEEVQAAMQEGGDILVQSIQGAMNWKSGNGDLESSIAIASESPYEIIVGSDLPYARRRDRGFSGMTDSLGRYYKDDPGAFYMEQGMQASQDQIFGLIEAAAQRAIDKTTGAS